MVLAIDIGNSDIVLGGYENDVLQFTSRCGTDRRKTVDEYALLFKGILELHNVTPKQVKGGIVASVVPSLRIIVQQAMELLTHAPFLTLAAGRKTGLNIRLDWPTELGSDLVADAVAAVDRYPKPVIIMDLGTATAVLVVDKKGAYLGGMLHPGLRISLEALSASADQLPSIMLKAPERLIGRNTEECMQAGAVYGCAAMLDGLIDRLEDELGESATAVITGGFAPLIAPYCRREVVVDENLLLNGLYIIYKKNIPRR